MQAPTFYYCYTKEGHQAASFWADEVTTRFMSDSPYEKQYGTFFYLDGRIVGDAWSDCLDWRCHAR